MSRNQLSQSVPTISKHSRETKYQSSEPRPLTTVTLSDLKSEQVDWLWPGRIPLGKLSLLDGDPGLGKSTLTLAIAAAVSSGAPMPGETVRREPGNVLLISVEDGITDTIRPRLEAAKADLSRINCVTTSVSLGQDLDGIGQLIRDQHALLVVIDPLMAVLGTDGNNDQKCRSVLTPLGEIAARSGAAILMVRHLTKAGKSALHRGGGSMGIMGAARAAMLFARHPDDPSLRVLASSKSNLGPEAPSINLRFTATTNGVAVIEYAGPAKQTANALLATPGEPEKKRAIDEVCDVLRDALASGPVTVNHLKKTVAEAGFGWMTARRAKDVLGIVSEAVGFGEGWLWRLPEGAQRAVESTFAGHEQLARPKPPETKAVIDEREGAPAEGAQAPKSAIDRPDDEASLDGVDHEALAAPASTSTAAEERAAGPLNVPQVLLL